MSVVLISEEEGTMKKLKTILFNILAAAVVFSLVACQAATNEETDENKTSAKENETEVTAGAAAAEEAVVDEEALKKVVYFAETYRDEFISGFETVSRSSGTVDMWALGTTIVLEYCDNSLISLDEKQFEALADEIGGPESIWGALRLTEPAITALQVDLYDAEHKLLFSKTYE